MRYHVMRVLQCCGTRIALLPLFGALALQSMPAKGGIEDWDDLQDVQRTVLDVIWDWAFDRQAVFALI